MIKTMVQVRVIEIPGKILAELQIFQEDGTVQHYYLPKFMLDEIKTKIQNGTYNVRTLLKRETDNTYDI